MGEAKWRRIVEQAFEAVHETLWTTIGDVAGRARGPRRDGPPGAISPSRVANTGRRMIEFDCSKRGRHIIGRGDDRGIRATRHPALQRDLCRPAVALGGSFSRDRHGR
jgi:hypothetical protein